MLLFLIDVDVFDLGKRATSLRCNKREKDQAYCMEIQRRNVMTSLVQV